MIHRCRHNRCIWDMWTVLVDTQNISSAAWVIYSPLGQILSSAGSCLGLSTNNLVEYSVVIELLTNSIGHGIDHLIVKLDS